MGDLRPPHSRGVKFINIPTTLLAAVDASVGGKTGINFEGLKKRNRRIPRGSGRHHLQCFFGSPLPREELPFGLRRNVKHAYWTR